MEAVVFRHTAFSDPAHLGMVLRAHGFSLTQIDTYCDDFSGFDPLKPDLLLVMGGSPGVYQADLFPFLKEEIKVIEKRLAADRPVIGICLGAQLMAAALGARVYKGEQGRERGWHEITVNGQGMLSPVCVYDRQYTRVMQSHGDTFDLPRGATLLAGSALYPHQIFSYGRASFAFQPHIEMSAKLHKAWEVDSAYAVHEGRIDLPTMREEAAKYLPTLNRQTEKFVESWIRLAGFADLKKAG